MICLGMREVPASFADPPLWVSISDVFWMMNISSLLFGADRNMSGPDTETSCHVRLPLVFLSVLKSCMAYCSVKRSS